VWLGDGCCISVRVPLGFSPLPPFDGPLTQFSGQKQGVGKGNSLSKQVGHKCLPVLFFEMLFEVI
jgi:hypothetical protein